MYSLINLLDGLYIANILSVIQSESNPLITELGLLSQFSCLHFFPPQNVHIKEFLFSTSIGINEPLLSGADFFFFYKNNKKIELMNN